VGIEGVHIQNLLPRLMSEIGILCQSMPQTLVEPEKPDPQSACLERKQMTIEIER